MERGIGVWVVSWFFSLVIFVVKSCRHEAFRLEVRKAKFQKEHGRGRLEKNLELWKGHLVTKYAHFGRKQYLSGIQIEIAFVLSLFFLLGKLPLTLLDKKLNNLPHQSHQSLDPTPFSI